MSTQPPPTTFYDLLCETTRVLFSNRRHFLILSVLFLLPQSLFGTIYFGWFLLHPKLPTTASVIVFFMLGALSVIVSFPAIATISFSAYNFLLGRPIKLITSIHSLLRSFHRLLITSLAFLLMNFLVLFALGLLAGVVMKIETLWFEIDETSFFYYLTGINIIVLGSILVVSCVPLLKIISWLISCVIIVIEESKQGLEPLRRSVQLIKEMNQVVPTQLALFIACILLWSGYGFSNLIKYVNKRDSGSLLFVFGIAVNTGVSTVLSLVYIVAMTVLYCKVTGESVTLPLVDDYDEKDCKNDSHLMPTSEIGIV